MHYDLLNGDFLYHGIGMGMGITITFRKHPCRVLKQPPTEQLVFCTQTTNKKLNMNNGGNIENIIESLNIALVNVFYYYTQQLQRN